MERLLSLLSLAIIMAGCANLPTYHPALKIGDSGFSEQRIDATHYRVTFQGDTATSRPHVEDYLLFRAAELTDEVGYEYFIIMEKQTDIQTTITTVQRPALYGRYEHFHGHRIYNFPYYAYGYDWGYPLEMESREQTRYLAIAYVEMFNGEFPANTKHAFKPSEVMGNLGPIDCWKTEPHDKNKCKLTHS